jgi:hypothetical protein
MIDEKYIIQPELDLNIDRLTKIVLEKVDYSTMKLPIKLRINIDTDEYLNSIRKKYPFLADMMLVYIMPNGLRLPPHIDFRECALNIPILNTESSLTSFYKFKSGIEENFEPFDKKQIFYRAREDDIEKDFSFIMDRPTILNTKKVHDVVVSCQENEGRIIISWIILDVDFETLKQNFKDNIY